VLTIERYAYDIMTMCLHMMKVTVFH